MPTRSAARPLLFAALCSAILSLGGCDASDDVDTGGGSTGETSGDSTSSGSSTASSTSVDETTDGSTGEASSGSTGEATSSQTSTSTGAGDESSTGDGASGYADLAGDYVETYPGGMTLHALTATSWSVDYGQAPIEQVVVLMDDDAQWVVLEDVGAGTFSRNDWAYDDAGLLRYCTGAFGQASAQDAAAAAPSDPSDFDGVGCGGMFPWSTLELVIR